MQADDKQARVLESLRDEMRKLTYSFDSRQRMEQIFSIALPIGDGCKLKDFGMGTNGPTKVGEK